jgi:hypothetical protein
MDCEGREGRRCRPSSTVVRSTSVVDQPRPSRCRFGLKEVIQSNLIKETTVNLIRWARHRITRQASSVKHLVRHY